VSGPGATVRWPRYSKVMDFELEFGIFLGKTGTDIPAGKAREHIFGYTIYNDFSARDAQMNEMPAMLGPTKGKSFQGGNALGPWIVTPDEIPDARALAVEVRVNSETWSKNTTAEMLFTFEEVIEFISGDETLHAGEFIGSGTVGNCCGLELDRYLEHGDEIELEVEQIGVLRNKVIRQDM
jgi:2-keto-4-pentenoate hydratase/2-oxohepta-3-ene-1,7-dioic acid hydratase in catechol pathway